MSTKVLLTTYDRDDARFRITPMQQCVSSCLGAMTTSLMMTPFDVVKTRLQAQQKLLLSNKCFVYCNGLMDHICPCFPNGNSNKPQIHFKGTVDAFVKISRYEGVKSFWSGLGPTLVLALPTTVLYFVAYEQFRIRLKEFNMRRTGSKELPLWVPLVAGCSARVLSVTCVNPLELIRTKMQSQKMSYSEIGSAVRIILKDQGILGLWKGWFPTVLRDVPFSSIYWSTYETCKTLKGVEEPSVEFSFMAGALSGSVAAFFTVPFDVVKTHQQIEIGEKVIYNDKPAKPIGTFESMHKIYQSHGIRGLFSGLTPRLLRVAPACAIMISSFEYGKSFFYRYNIQNSEHKVVFQNQHHKPS